MARVLTEKVAPGKKKVVFYPGYLDRLRFFLRVPGGEEVKGVNFYYF